MPELRLTLCILTAAAEPGLSEAVSGARSSVDEVLVGYTGSPAEVAEVAQLPDARALHIPWRNDFAAARNALLDAARGDWVLILDADERIELPEVGWLRALTAGAEAPGYWLPIYSPTGPAQGRETYLSRQVRLFRNSPENRYQGLLGEQLPQELLAAAQNLPTAGAAVIHHRGFMPAEVEQRSRYNLALLDGTTPVPNLALSRGMQLLRQGFMAEALGQFAAAEGAEGTLAAHLTRWRAYCLLALGRPAEALGLLEEGCRNHPGYTDLWLLWGQALAAVGRRSEAELALRRCLDLGEAPPPYESVVGAGDALPLLVLGELAEQGGRPAEAVQLCTEAYRARPDRSDRLYRVAGVLGLAGQTREMASVLRQLVHPQTAEQWLLLADVLSVQREYRAALRCVRAAAERGADPADVALMRGFCLLRLGKAAEAEAALAPLPPSHELALHALQMRLLAAWCRQDCPAALMLLEQLPQAAFPVGLFQAARALHYLLCRRDEPHGPGPAWGREGGEFLLQAVDALLASGQRQSAAQAAALIQHALWPDGYRALAVLFRLRGSRRQARMYFERALALGDGDPELLCSLAELELKARNWPRALDLTARAAHLAPDQPLPYLLRARIFRAQAVDLLRLACKRGDDPEAARLLAELTGEAGA